VRVAVPVPTGCPNDKTPASRIFLGARAREPGRMSFSTAEWNGSISALDVRRQLIQLEAERALALEAGLGKVDAYMADLAEELELRRSLYVAAAVTEMATLRGELFGRQVG
jgi:hypothetical protein